MSIANSVKINIATTLSFVALILGSLFPGEISAQTNPTPPSFPQCTDKIFSVNGDWANYDSGIHGIVGVGNFEGSDDVYALNDGNFLQCFCPAGGTLGTQTNWWNVQRAGLTSDQISSFVSQSWFSENGAGWNLYNEAYLAKNQNFSCVPTPTQPPSQGGGFTPAGAPVCSAPSVTKAPLYSKANLTRIDSDSIKVTWEVTDGNAQRYGFHYGTNPNDLKWYTEVTGHDTKQAEINSVPQGNIYFKVCSIGTCGDSVCGSDIPTVLATTTQLPSTGTGAIILLSIAPLGYYLYRRFRLV